MIDVYTTIQGDTFESVAFWLYGDEKFMKELIEANWDKSDVLVFDAGVKLFAPDVYDDAEEGEEPFWRSDDDDSEADEDDYYEYDEDIDDDDEDLTDSEALSKDPDIEDEEDAEDE